MSAQGGRGGREFLLISNKVVNRGGGEHSIPRARGTHLERDIMVARGNEKVLMTRGTHDNMLINIKKRFRVL